MPFYQNGGHSKYRFTAVPLILQFLVFLLWVPNYQFTHLCHFSKTKLNLYEAWSLTASTLLHRVVLSIELGTVQTGIGKVDPARKFKCTMAARELHFTKGIILILRRTKEIDIINLLILGFTTLKCCSQDSFKYLGSGFT